MPKKKVIVRRLGDITPEPGGLFELLKEAGLFDDDTPVFELKVEKQKPIDLTDINALKRELKRLARKKEGKGLSTAEDVRVIILSEAYAKLLPPDPTMIFKAHVAA